MKKAFTLIELLIVIVILGILAALVSGNLINSLAKGRDARRKADLENIQKALELYYEDNRTYPASANVKFGTGDLCAPAGCSTKTYMHQVPNDPQYKSPGSTTYYYVSSDPQHYQMYATIENINDEGPGVKQAGYAGTNCVSTCKFGLSDSASAP